MTRICFSDPYASYSDYEKNGLRYSEYHATKRSARAALARYMRPTADKPFPCAWLSEEEQ